MIKIEKNEVRKGQLVGTDHVDNIIRNYKRERWINNSKHIGKEDSLSVWYSLEALEEFLALAKQYGGDGIKVYFGAYDEAHAPDPMYVDRQTVVFVATKEKQTPNGVANKDLYINTEAGNSVLAFNSGTMCPPFCNGGNDGTIGITILDKGDEGFIVT